MTECDNNHTKWCNTVEFYNQEGNNFNTDLPDKKTNDDKKESGEAEDPLHDAKYTSSSGGQKRFGTYSEAGLKYFSGMQNTLKGRAKGNAKEIAAFETKFLEKLMVADEVGTDGLSLKKKNGKKRKIPGQGGPKKRAKVTICMDSDTEDEDGDDSDATTLDEQE